MARTHSLWQAALRSGDVDWAHSILRQEAHAAWGDPRFVAMRLWDIGHLLKRGRVRDANIALQETERRAGTTSASRLIAARLAYFANDFEACASACRDAVVLSPPGPLQREIYALWGDALCQQERHEEAWTLLTQAFPSPGKMSNSDIRALRLTVVTPSHLSRFAALLTPLFAGAQGQARAALYHYSLAARDLHLYGSAGVAIRQRFLNAVEDTPFGAAARPRKGAASWVGDASAALRDLKAVMDRSGTPFFLISGTLLGCVRERGIIGHDKDIDVGVMETAEVRREPLHEALRASAVFLVKPYQHDALLRVQHSSGVLIDIFWHRTEGGLVIHEGMKSKWWNTPFQLREIDFLDDRYLIPETFERYLGENYGDWQVPDPNFETFIDTPNMIVTSDDEMIWYYYAKLHDYYVGGKEVQFRKVVNRIMTLQPDDHQINLIGHRVIAALDAHQIGSNASASDDGS